jgi:hypothetical protein
MKKLMIMSAVALVSAFTMQNVFSNVLAVDPPDNYDASYRREENPENSDALEWVIFNNLGYDNEFYYTREQLGSLYKYTGNYIDFYPGVDLKLIFTHPTTTFDAVSGSFFKPSNSTWYIGGDPVDVVGDQVYIEIENSSSRDFTLYFDNDHTTNSNTLWYYTLNGNYISNYGNDYLFTMSTSQLTSFYVPSSSTFVLKTAPSEFARFFNAIYLNDLGQSAAFEAGVDAGILWGGSNIFDIVGNALGAVTKVLNIYIFPGNVTLGMIVLTPIAISLLFFVLGLVSGRKR